MWHLGLCIPDRLPDAAAAAEASLGYQLDKPGPNSNKAVILSSTQDYPDPAISV